jgi:hypothetical protein
MNGGKVPNIESAWGYVCRAEGEKALQGIVSVTFIPLIRMLEFHGGVNRKA